MHHEIHINTLQNVALSRPAGYLDDVLSHGNRIGDVVYIPDDKYQMLCQKYSSYRIKETNPSGPGSLLAKIIHQLTGAVPKDCMTCSARVKQMNVWGWLGCWQNRHTITGWLAEEAGKLGYNIEGNVISGLLIAAVREHLDKG